MFSSTGDGWRPQVRDRRLSDSVLLVKPNQDEVSLMKLTRLESKIKLLEERVEILERERPVDVIPEGLGKLIVFHNSMMKQDEISVLSDLHVGSNWK